MLNRDQVMSLFRWLLSSGGAALVAHGWLTDSGAQEMLYVGMTAAALVWSQIFHSGPVKGQLVDVVKETPAIGPEVKSLLGVK